ncbi:MAG: hypothetical protein ACO1OQ_01060 [Rufibacter sp.]
MNPYIKWFLIVFGGAIGLYCLYIIVTLFFLFGGFSGSSSKEELVENYHEKSREIEELHAYFNSIVPEGYTVYIEFQDDSSIDFTVSEKDDSLEFGRNLWFQAWDINPYNYREEPGPPKPPSHYEPNTTSLNLITHRLGWTSETFKQIKHHLDKANCISIENGEPSSIGFARSGMGKYFYAVFQSPIPDSLKATYNDSCHYLYFKPKVALEFAGGAIGAQCFPDL